MNILQVLDDLDMGWEGYKSEHNVVIKLHRVDDNTIPQQYVAEDESESEIRKVEFRNTTKVCTMIGYTGEFGVTANGVILEVPDRGDKSYIMDAQRAMRRQEQMKSR